MESKPRGLDTTPIGTFVVAGIILGCFFPMMTGLVTHGAAPLIGGIILGSAIVFIVLMVVEIQNGNLFGAVLNGVFGVLLGIAPALSMLAEFAGAGMGVAVDPRILGWYFMVVGLALFIIAFGAGTHFWHMAVLFWILCPVMIMTGMVFAGVGPPSWFPMLGWTLFGAGVYFLYMAAASFLGGMFRRPVLPVGGPLFKVPH